MACLIVGEVYRSTILPTRYDKVFNIQYIRIFHRKMNWCAIIISVLAIVSISFASKNYADLDVIEKATAGKLDNLSRQLRRLTESQDGKVGTSSKDITSPVAREEKSPVDEFFDEVIAILREAKPMFTKHSLPDLGFDRFPQVIDTLKKPLDANMKKKRVIQEIKDTTEKGIKILGISMTKLIEAVKPIQGEAAAMAVDIHNAVGKASDKLLDAVVAAVG